VTWEYDAFSRRVKQHDTAPAGPEIVRDLIWEGLSIIENRNQATGEIRRFYGNGEERQLAAAVTRLHYTTDHLGSIRELTDATGTVRARYDYDPYGNVTKLSGNLDTDFAYTGHYYHAASGLHLAPYRGYNPKLGRWLSRDPIGEEGGINLYGYVGNAPINLFDPLGLAPQELPNSCVANALQEGIKTVTGKTVPEKTLMKEIDSNHDYNKSGVIPKKTLPVMIGYGVKGKEIKPDDIPDATKTGPVMITVPNGRGGNHELLIKKCEGEPGKRVYTVYDPKTGTDSQRKGPIQLTPAFPPIHLTPK
jgi:RHS repeat-associated protein